MKIAEKNLKNTYYCVIPVYNNFTTIEDVVRRVLCVTENVLIIDDGSTDADLQEFFRRHPVEVFRHGNNQGKGAALISALNILRQRNVDYMITLDGDGQHFPEDIPGIIERLEKENELVLLAGVRDLKTPAVPYASRIGRALSNYFIKLESGVSVLDSQCGLRAYPVSVTGQMDLGTRHYDFETEILLDCALNGIKIVNFPVNVYYPEAGGRISHYRKILDTCRIIKVHLRLLGRRIFRK
ncbi:MAG: glycosyltransferase family 2 protein [Lentisphaerae bacterium]|nr:glycosyltransferase family 2 protein [Lentisphaerota bacterium]